MFEKIKNAWGTTFPDEPFGFTEAQIEETLIAHPVFGEQIATMSEAEKGVYIEAHMPDILAALHGGETATTATPAAKRERIEPETFNRLSEGRKTAIENALNKDAELKACRTAGSHIDAVLIAKDCPATWMGEVPACPLKDGNNAAVLAQKPAVPGSITDWLKGAQDKDVMVPTNEQLKELAALHKQRWEAKNPDKIEKYKAPEWATADNDADVAAVRKALADGSAMQVLVTGKEADPVTHSKAWRWSTKGYKVTYPTGLDGEGGMTTKNFSLIGLRNFLLNDADGAILPDKNDETALSAKLLMTRSRVSKNNPGVQAPKTVLRVRGNSPSNAGLTLIPLQAPVSGKQTTMVVKSAMSFIVVRASVPTGGDATAEVNFRVSRQRLSLVWATAPVFETLQEYAGIPYLALGRGASTKKTQSKKEKQDVRDARRNLYAALVSGEISGDKVQEMGLADIARSLNEELARSAAIEASSFQ